MDDKQPHTLLLRGMAGMAGLALALVSAAAWLAADRLLWALNEGGAFADRTQAAVQRSVDASSASDQELVAAHAALTGAAYTVDHYLGNMISATKQFELFVALALVAGLVAGGVACLRRPREVWPEWVWAGCAVIALLPAVAAGWWGVLGLPFAATLALAALLHLTRRHDFTLSRGATAVAPHAQSALDRGAPAARKAIDQGGAAGRAALEKGAPAARKALAGGGAALKKLPRRRKPDGPPWELPPQSAAPPWESQPEAWAAGALPPESAREPSWPANPRPDEPRKP